MSATGNAGGAGERGAIVRAAVVRGAALLAAIVFAAGVEACGRPPLEPADLVIKNARIVTMDPSRPRAEAIAIRGDRILAVGSEPEIGRHLAKGTRVIDAHGRMILPGFIDSHNHISFGSDPDVVELAGARTLEEIVGRVRAFASSHPTLTWIEGEGWNYSALPGGRLPTARDLEGATGGRPAFLVSYDVHTVWLNREAIEKLKIDLRTKSLPFGEIDRDPGGRATGLLRSFATMGLSQEGQAALRSLVPSYSTARRYESLKRNLEAAAGFGITTIVDPQVFLEDLPLYGRARDEGVLRSRLQLALFHPRGMPEADLVKFDEARRVYNDDRLRVSAVKLYIDDVVEPHTAAMLEPYSDRPDLRGETLYPPEEFKDVVAGIDRMKFQMFIHAIGDRGIRVALDALQAARERNGPRDSRHQLVHVECLSPADVGRFKDLGVVACMQPRHCAPDISAKWAANIGPERSRLAWAFRSLRDAGAVLAFASDWNVAEMDPLVGIDSALTRRGLDGQPAGGWIPDQTIDLDTTLRAYTIQGAYANFVDPVRGSIVAGKEADLVVLSDDLFALQPDRIKSAHVLLTLVGGREIYRSSEPI